MKQRIITIWVKTQIFWILIPVAIAIYLAATNNSPSGWLDGTDVAP